MRFAALTILLVLSCLTPLGAQELKFDPASEPFESSSGELLTLYHNIGVSNENGEPTQLTEATQVGVELSAFEDEESGLSFLPALTSWNFPAGFAGGRRQLETAVFGPAPVKGIELIAPIRLTLADGTLLEQTVKILVRAGATEGGGGGLCIQPGDGEEYPLSPTAGSGISPGWVVFNDTRPLAAIGSAQFKDAPAATIENTTTFQVVEVLADGTTAPAPFSIENLHTRVVDADGDGTAESLVFGLRMSRTGEIELAPNDAGRTSRVFELRAVRTDVLPNPVASIYQFDVSRREWVEHDVHAVLGDDAPVLVGFKREQSHALKARPVLYHNGVQLPAAAQATAKLEPGGLNGDVTWTGLFDLAWDVEVDFARLAMIGGFALGDTLTVELRFPGSGVAALNRDLEVLQDGINASVFKSLEDLAEKTYDDDTNEQEHVEALVQALCDAGLMVDDDGKLTFPSLIEDEGDDPQWGDIRGVANAIRAAILAYKNAPRNKDGVSCLVGEKEWEVRVTIEKDGKQVPVVIVLDTTGDGASADDKKSGDGSLVIAIGKCGKDGTGNTDGTDGSKATAKLSKDGSLGIAAGGNGGQGGDQPDSPSGGNGGKSSVDAKGRGSTGISLGGHGGSTEGNGSKGGNGGDSETDAEKRSNGLSEAGSSGSQKLPPPDSHTSTGKASVKNDSAVPDKKGGVETKRREVGEGKLEGTSGSTKGGIVRAKPDKTMDDNTAKVVRNDPTTGG